MLDNHYLPRIGFLGRKEAREREVVTNDRAREARELEQHREEECAS